MVSRKLTALNDQPDMTIENTQLPTLLIVDDEPINLKAMHQVLQKDYRLIFATSGTQALEIAKSQKPDLILLDILLGEDMDGYVVCKKLKADEDTAKIPVIFITVLDEIDDEEKGFDVGAVDYISKPIKPPIVRARIQTHLSLVRVDLLNDANMQIIQRLSRAAEYKSLETSKHIIRMSSYAEALALAVGQSKTWATHLLHAAPMHDVGKIGVPNVILDKPGKLSKDEWNCILQHPEMGAVIIGNHENEVLKMAYNVAFEHHEKWDGSGYPRGLKGKEITLEARITAIADVFDALTTARPYKEAWSVEQAWDFITQQKGKHFDPQLADAFLGIKPRILEIREKNKE